MKNTIVALLLSTLCLTTVAYGNPKAGFMTTEGVTVLAGDDSVRVTVWYPTSNQEKGPSEYVVDPDTPSELRYPAGATRDAPIKGGTFPLIVFNSSAGQGDTHRVFNFPTAELLAADGYIVVNAGRSNTAFEAQGPHQSGLIDYMLWDHPLRDSIDADKIGLRALSFGGLGAGSVAGGDVYGNQPDPRVRGVIIDEGLGVCDANLGTVCDSVTIPMLLRDGSDFGAVPPFPDIIGDHAREFGLLENAFPRFLINLRNPDHVSFNTWSCPFTEALRLASLAYQEDVLGGIVEPEPRNLSYFEASQLNGDFFGTGASFFWNQGMILPFPNVPNYGDWCQPQYGGPLTPGVGTIMDSATMLETMYVLDKAFWETVFGNGQSDNTKLEKAAETLDSVVSIIAVKE